MHADATYTALVADLAEEQLQLHHLLMPVAEPDLDTPTPAPGWSVRDQLSHLAFFDETAALALMDETSFAAQEATAAADLSAYVQLGVDQGRQMTGSEVIDWWVRARTRLLDVLHDTSPKSRPPWYGRRMSVQSFATARLMETWAHGQDIIDGLGVQRAPSDRLAHIARLGFLARPFSYVTHGRPEPTAEVLVELVLPSQTTWSAGSPTAAQRITGTALDFALVVTQRRHWRDTELHIVGVDAHEWMEIAQAFAGPPGVGRSPGEFGRDQKITPT